MGAVSKSTFDDPQFWTMCQAFYPAGGGKGEVPHLCTEMETGGPGMICWGPAASMLKDMPVRTQHIRSEAPSSTRTRIRQGTARAVQCIIYAQSLQINPPNPAVCHGILRQALRGGHGHVQRPHIDPIPLYLVTLRSQGVCPQVPGNKKYGRKK